MDTQEGRSLSVGTEVLRPSRETLHLFDLLFVDFGVPKQRGFTVQRVGLRIQWGSDTSC